MTKPKKPKQPSICDKCNLETDSPCKLALGKGRAVVCQKCAHKYIRMLAGRGPE